MTRSDYLKVVAAAFASALAATLVMLIAVKPTDAAFPGRNGKIAFTGFPPPPSSSEIYVMNRDGSGKKNLTKSTTAGEGDPTFSSDGKRIAFSRLRVSDSDIWVMNADGSHRKRITTNPANENEPTWSPDGTRIAFTTNRDGNSEIYVKRLAGGNARNLTNNPEEDFGPSWSPNGKWIAFASDRNPAFDRDIFRMRTDGSNQINLTSSPTTNDIRPDWKPNSKSIVYQSDLDIFRMASDGSNQTNLSNDPAADYAPVFSPTGRSIAFTSDRDGDEEIFRMSSGGLNPVNLTNNAKPLDGFPGWQPLP